MCCCSHFIKYSFFTVMLTVTTSSFTLAVSKLRLTNISININISTNKIVYIILHIDTLAEHPPAW